MESAPPVMSTHHPSAPYEEGEMSAFGSLVRKHYTKIYKIVVDEVLMVKMVSPQGKLTSDGQRQVQSGSNRANQSRGYDGK